MPKPLDSTLESRDHPPTGRGLAGPEPHLFLALQGERPLAPGAAFRIGGAEQVTLGRGAELRASSRGGALAIELPDAHVSAGHARLLRERGGWVLEDLGSRNGTRVDGVPIRKRALLDGEVFEVGYCFFVFRAALEALQDGELAAPQDLPTLLPQLRRVLGQLAAIARSGVEVLLHGESGTGKELAARAVHALSGRGGPFVAVNCGALTAGLVQSELFGHRKGAFSGASGDHLGVVRSADQGTLLLDEIGDLSAAAQAGLLRVLQEQEVVPVGDTRPVKVDVRLIAATHQDLEQLAARGHFRGDLLARLRAFTLKLPPLRERREDLGLIVAALLQRLDPAGATSCRFRPDAIRALFRHPWPHNIRELQKALGVARALAGDGPIELRHLPEHVRTPAEGGGGRPPNRSGQRPEEPLTAAEERHREELIALLRAHRGSVSAVARAQGKARTQVHRWVRRYGLDLREFR